MGLGACTRLRYKSAIDSPHNLSFLRELLQTIRHETWLREGLDNRAESGFTATGFDEGRLPWADTTDLGFAP
jgi:hypothetical protein